jgi:hypothetical protein
MKDDNIQLGRTYLYEEDRPLNSFKVFFNSVNDDVLGLIITRTNPKMLQRTYQVLEKSTTVFWLTDVDSTDQTVDPNEVERLSAIITDFIYDCLKKNVESVILLDGVEYIMTKSSFNQTLQLIHHLKDIVSMYNTLLIIPLSPEAIEIRERKMLERDLDVVKF